MRMGIPKVITSDQGREFNNKLNGELMERLQIDHRLTTPYHPQVRLSIIESVDSISRDGPDCPYM